ncbi:MULTISPECIES: hypothetical protein [unclassified Phyllobacterium]|uniref:hypothetical protein n=1 Tax=unclassified Phyllobacterium TaxID=2638441 RepID=UPI003012A132
MRAMIAESHLTGMSFLAAASPACLNRPAKHLQAQQLPPILVRRESIKVQTLDNDQMALDGILIILVNIWK